MMKKLIVTVLLFLPTLLCAETAVDESDPSRLSEALGHLIARQLNQPGFTFNLDRVIQGMRDEMSGKPSPMSEEEYEQEVCALQEQRFLQTAEQNLAAANSFLQENISKAGIHIIDPQLHYLVLNEGNGESVTSDSIPLIHYKGTLIDGTVFASSESSEQPISLPIKQSIPGFAKGLVGMKEGEKRILYIHPELAYGLAGHLPPNSLLIFEVEIVKAHALSLDEATLNNS